MKTDSGWAWSGPDESVLMDPCRDGRSDARGGSEVAHYYGRLVTAMLQGSNMEALEYQSCWASNQCRTCETKKGRVDETRPGGSNESR